MKKMNKTKRNSLALNFGLLLSLGLIFAVVYSVGLSDAGRYTGPVAADILCLTIIGSVTVFVLMIKESGKMQTDNAIYGGRELFTFYCASNIFKILILLVIILIYLESYFSSNLISEIRESDADSTAGLIIYAIIPFMIMTNATIIYIGEIISARKIKKTLLAKILTPFAAIILTISIMIACDAIMPNRILYIFAKALYLI